VNRGLGGRVGRIAALGDILQDLLLERQIGDQPFQPGVLPLELLEPLSLLDLEAAILVAPAIVALLGDLGLFARLADGTALRHKHFNLPQLRDDLFGAMSFSGHLPELLSKLIISISLVQENPVRSLS